MIDYHVHPDFSQDATGSIRDFCARASEVGLEEICFTTHYEPDPERAQYECVYVAGSRRAVDSDWAEVYLAQIESCRREFPRLTVLAGVEAGYEPGLDGMIGDFLGKYAFDFVLGAVHCLDHVAITSGQELERYKAEYLPHGGEHAATRYFQYVRSAAGSGLFDCLAHLDVYRKYIQPLHGQSFRTTAESLLEPTLEFIARSRTGLEVNSSALRRGADQPYPAEAILRSARDAGVCSFTTGSDAHRPDDLAGGLGEVECILSRLGVEPARFRNRERVS